MSSPPSGSNSQTLPISLFSLYRAEGLNHVVKEDVVDDAESPIIVDMSCIDEEFEKVRIINVRVCFIENNSTTFG